MYSELSGGTPMNVQWSGGQQDWQMYISMTRTEGVRNVNNELMPVFVLLAQSTANDGQQTVTIPASTLPGSYYLRIECVYASCPISVIGGETPSDRSDAPFSIVAQ